MTATSPLAPTVTPRLAKNSRRRSTALLTRFRAVSVTLSAVKELPQPRPASWLLPEVQGHRLRFIATDYADDAALYRQLAPHFGAIRLESEPMSLRAIANSLMQQRKRDLQP